MRAPQAALWAVLGLPVLAGVAGTVRLSLQGGLGAFAQAFALPGVGRSFAVTLISGGGATVLSLLLAVPLSHWLWWRAGLRGALAPVLAVPHAALALGLAFLLAPSGWAARLFAPLMGWVLPPQLVTVGDGWGLALMLGLVLKEAPFLALMSLAAASQLPVGAQMRAGQGLGHAPGAVWRRVIWPQLYPALRLPVFVSFAFSLSVADIALILGPSHPPTLAVMILRLLTAHDSALHPLGAALALFELALMAAGVVLWRLAEPVAGALNRRWRGPLPGAFGVTVAVAAAQLFGAALSLALWSFAARWPWPQPVPQPGLAFWARGGWMRPALGTLSLGMVAAGLSVALAAALLEAADRAGQRFRPGVLLFIPLLLPQIGFLPGFATVQIWLGLPPGWPAVLWAEMLFTLPYALLALAGPWQALPPDMLRSAASLGADPWRLLWRIKLPLLARPLAIAGAVAFAVSASQYLAVLLPGAGRVSTLGTEAVALAAGADRRAAAGMGLLLGLLPMLGFWLALAVPAWGRDSLRKP